MPKRDLTGQRFASLKVVKEAGQDKNNRFLWLCLCDCGREHVVRGDHLTSGKIRSCRRCFSNSFRLSTDGSYVIGTFRDGSEFFIDAEDFEKVKAHVWFWSSGYAETCINGRHIKLHQFLMAVPDNMRIDHINMIKTDNRKANLRFATHKENNRNKGLQINNTSGAKGVDYIAKCGKYRARITVDGRTIHLGHYTSLIEASEVRDRAALHYFGEFARLNNLRETTPELNAGVFPSAAK